MKPFEKVLRLGDEGPLVEDLQARLIQLGFKSTYLQDGSVGVLEEPTGVFGEITQELLSRFQAQVIDAVVLKEFVPPANAVMEATGEMDFYTHWILNNYEKLAEFYKEEILPEEIEIPEEEIPQEAEPVEKLGNTLIKKVIELAKGELGVKEAGGNNYGDRVEEYQKIGSNNEVDGGQPWCQYFMNWLMIMACEAFNIKYKGTYSGYTPFWINWGKEKKICIINPKMENIEVGDFMYVYSSARKSAKHVALVIGKSGNNVITIEGNTNPGGGADGFGVFKRERPCPWAVVKWHKMY